MFSQISKLFLIFQALFHRLFECSAIFWTEANGGQWLKLSEALFLEDDVTYRGSTDQCHAARTFLAKAGHKIVSVPGTKTIVSIF